MSTFGRVLLILLACSGMGSTVAEARPRTKAQAAAKVNLAVEAYRTQRYAEAAQLFLEAYAESGVPNQLRNAAKAYQEGGLEDEAERTWERYRDHPGLSASDRAEAQAQLELSKERRRARLAEAEAEAANARARAEQRAKEEAEAAARLQPPPPPPPALPPPPPPALSQPVPPAGPAVIDGPPIVAYAGAGIGAALVVTGAALLIESQLALSDLDQHLAMIDGAGKINGITASQAQADLDGLNLRRGVGAAGLGLGSVLLTAAVIALLWPDDPPHRGVASQ